MKKYLIASLLLILTVAELNAQESETVESNIKQLKTNSAPGLRYAPAGGVSTPQVQPHTTMAEEIKKGKFGAIKAGSGSGGAVAKPVARNTGGLPSDKSATDAAREAKSTQKAPAVQILPTQEGSNGAPAELKAVPAKNAKLIPVKKDQQ